MPTVHTRYVTWISRGRRHHGSSSEDLIMPLSTQVPDNGTYQAWAAPSIGWNDQSGHHDAGFAFWSITGAADGASVTTSQTPTVHAGSTDVSATAWYIPSGGGGGGPGVLIDAFDVGLGNFVDDDFVDVVTDAGLTAAANNDGWVPTASPEDIRAYTSIHAVPFLDWTVVAGTEPAAGRDLNATAGSSAVAFAFYQAPVLGKLHIPVFEEGTWVSWGVMVDGGGPTGRGPVPPWTPFVRELAAGLALAETAGLVNPELRGSVLRLAAKQVAAAANAISKQMQGGTKLGG